MSIKKSLLATSLMAMAAMSNTTSYNAPQRVVSKTPLTKKQKKARQKSKNAKQARRK